MMNSTICVAWASFAKKLAICILPAVAAATVFLTGCGSSSSSSTQQQQPISVTVSPATVTMDSGQAQVFSASVANDSTNAGVSWTISGGGALSASSATGTTFTASATSATKGTLTATSKASAAAAASASITVNPALTIQGPASGTGTVGTPYTDSSTTAGGGSGTKTFAIATGTLPTGLVLSSTTGAISGTPTAAGAFNFSISVTDAATSPVTVTAAAITITILQPGISVALNNAEVTVEAGQAVSFTATVSNDSANKGVTWTTSGGGTLSGSTATSTTFTAASSTSASSATVTATSVSDTTKSATATITITSGPVITSHGALPNGTVGIAYSNTLAETGGTAPFTYSVSSGSLPAGLSLNAGSGTISGTPTSAVTSLGFTVKVTDSAPNPQSNTSAVMLTINAANTLSIATSSLPQATPGTPYSTTLKAVGGVLPYTWSVTFGGLPAGMTLDASTGIISGTTAANAESSFRVQVTDSQTPTPATAASQLQLVVQPALPVGANDSELTGTYAFRLAGITNGGTTGVDYGASAIGSITFDGAGNITSGVTDVNDMIQPVSANPLTGNYTLGADNRGTILLDTGSSVVTLAIAAGDVTSSVAQTVRLIRFDDNGATASGVVATGLAKLQTPAAFTQLNATYVFGMQGHSPCVGCAAEPVTPFGPVSLVGYFTAASGTITGGLADGAAMDASYNNVTLSGSSTAPATTTGRGTLTLTSTGTLFPAAPTHFVYYVVNANQFFLMSTDPHGGAQSGLFTLLSGEADLQQISTYTGNTLSGSAIAYGNIGIGGDGVGTNPTGTAAGIYRYTFNQGTGMASAITDSNVAGTLKSQTFPAAAYTLSDAGRLSVPGNNTPPVIYLYGNGEGFGTQQPSSTHNGSAGLLTFEPQMAGPFSIGSVAGSYVFSSLPPGSYDQGTNVGAATLLADGTIDATLDSSTNSGVLVSDRAVSGTFALDAGTGATTGRGTIAGSSIVYVINATRFVAIDSTATAAPNTTVFNAQTAP